MGSNDGVAVAAFVEEGTSIEQLIYRRLNGVLVLVQKRTAQKMPVPI